LLWPLTVPIREGLKMAKEKIVTRVWKNASEDEFTNGEGVE
jgi:hypothetical protein